MDVYGVNRTSELSASTFYIRRMYYRVTGLCGGYHKQLIIVNEFGGNLDS